MVGQRYFPDANIMLPLAALVGMAALFAGSARALLTSIVFAMETTMQESTLLPLIAGCVTSYMVSFVLMKTTIMTEKIHRRGIKLPDSYHPDVLEMQSIHDVLSLADNIATIGSTWTVGQLKDWLKGEGVSYSYNSILILSNDGKEITGVVDKGRLFKSEQDETASVESIVTRKAYSLYRDNSIQLAVEFILKTGQDILPIEDRKSHQFVGVISARDILRVFEQRFREEYHMEKHISISQQTKRVLVTGKNIFGRETQH
jgi:hypothetical protein